MFYWLNYVRPLTLSQLLLFHTHVGLSLLTLFHTSWKLWSPFSVVVFFFFFEFQFHSFPSNSFSSPCLKLIFFLHPLAYLSLFYGCWFFFKNKTLKSLPVNSPSQCLSLLFPSCGAVDVPWGVLTIVFVHLLGWVHLPILWLIGFALCQSSCWVVFTRIVSFTACGGDSCSGQQSQHWLAGGDTSEIYLCLQ